jgi:hypothetical protein
MAKKWPPPKGEKKMDKGKRADAKAKERKKERGRKRK